VIQIENLSKAYGEVPALSDVSLAAAQGEMLVLVGPSGCGKTTCLRCIAGLERPTAGRIRIGERIITAIEDGVFVPPEKREIGMVFQSYAVWPHMTVFENVAYPLRAMGVRGEEVRKRALEALKLVQLEPLAGRYSSQISGGQQQRVALARSLVGAPKLLLFDEPLSNLDANLRLQMRVEIKELQKRLKKHKIEVFLDDAAESYLAETGYDPNFGARPLKRVIQHEIQDVLAYKMLDKLKVYAGDSHPHQAQNPQPKELAIK